MLFYKLQYLEGSMMKINKFTLVILLTLSTQSTAWADNINHGLDEYGKKVSTSSEKGAIKYIKVYQTTEKPLNAYRMDFDTSEKNLLSVPNAAHDKTAKLQNLAITKAWEVKFCQPDLINFMLKNNIDMVSGALISKGEMQRMAVCFKSMQIPESVSDKSDKDVVIGSWYDDVGSPEFLDATFTITRTSQGYFLKRLNGDGSSGTYLLTKLDNKYKKNNDKFGSYYVIDGNGLKIYDKDGYIRTARKK